MEWSPEQERRKLLESYRQPAKELAERLFDKGVVVPEASLRDQQAVVREIVVEHLDFLKEIDAVSRLGVPTEDLSSDFLDACGLNGEYKAAVLYELASSWAQDQNYERAYLLTRRALGNFIPDEAMWHAEGLLELDEAVKRLGDAE